MPLNSITETLFYNHRMIIDSALYNQDSEMRAWLISKINRISPNGIARVTLAQDTFDQHNDYIERDKDGFIIGMWADYYKSNINPVPVDLDGDDNITHSSITSKVTCTGKPQFKIGGSVKTFTVTFYDQDNKELPDYEVGGWQWIMDGKAVPNELIQYSEISEFPNKIKIKFLGDDSYIGKILTIKNKSGEIESSLDMEIIAL